MADLNREIGIIDKKIKELSKELADLRRHLKQLTGAQALIEKMHRQPGPESGSPGTEIPPSPGQGGS